MAPTGLAECVSRVHAWPGVGGLYYRYHRGRFDGVDAMRKQSSVEPHPDEVFRSTPDIRGGIACFTGTRVGVSQLPGYLRDGHTIDDFPSDFPTVTKDQVRLAIERIDNESVRGIERECVREHHRARSTRLDLDLVADEGAG